MAVRANENEKGKNLRRASLSCRILGRRQALPLLLLRSQKNPLSNFLSRKRQSPNNSNYLRYTWQVIVLTSRIFNQPLAAGFLVDIENCRFYRLLVSFYVQRQALEALMSGNSPYLVQAHARLVQLRYKSSSSAMGRYTLSRQPCFTYRVPKSVIYRAESNMSVWLYRRGKQILCIRYWIRNQKISQYWMHGHLSCFSFAFSIFFSR